MKSVYASHSCVSRTNTSKSKRSTYSTDTYYSLHNDSLRITRGTTYDPCSMDGWVEECAVV